MVTKKVANFMALGLVVGWLAAGQPAQADCGLAAAQAAQVKERLALDVEREYGAGLFGRKDDDRYALSGKRITRMEFKPEVHAGPVGGADAKVAEADIAKGVCIHWWVDATCTVKYRLRVWVED